ncbi:MAG TPA: type II toxin-antitoxin system VapC family toxin [Longimicrobium sp.]|jgi:hypothetical protein
MTEPLLVETDVLVDTDILIDALRGFPQALGFIKSNQPQLRLSAITVTELYTGIRDPELEQVRDLLGIFSIIPIESDIARRAGLIRRQYLRSHNLGLADALIAATAQEAGIPLATLNRKHFPMMQVVTPYTKP